MNKVLILALVAATTLSASAGGEHGGTDIVPRTINFLIFAGILWYLLAAPLRNFFSGRSQEIADRLNSVQDKLRETKRMKEEAEKGVEDAKAFAAELKATMEKEKAILKANIEAQTARDLEVIEKQMTEKKELAERQMVQGVVKGVLAEVTEKASAGLDKAKMAEIIMKKVA